MSSVKTSTHAESRQVEHIQVRSKQEVAVRYYCTAPIDRLQSGSRLYTKQLPYRLVALDC